MPYRSNPRLADLLMRQGDISAQREMDRGRIWGGAVQGIGQQVAVALGDYAQQKADATRRAMADEQARIGLETGRLNLGAAQRRETEAQGTAAESQTLKERAEKVETVKGWLADVASSENPQAVYKAGRDQMVQAGVFIPEDAPEFFPGMGWVKSKMARLLPEAERYKQLFPEPEKPQIAPAGSAIVEDGKITGQVPFKAAEPPTVGSFEDYAVQRFGPRPTPEQITQARKDYQQADDRPIRISTSGSGLTPNMEANVTRQLATQWTAASKPARDLERQVSLIDAGMDAARRGDLSQGAQTVLVAFQKILDPTSVVREAEFDRSAAGQSLMNRVKGAAERLSKGGAGITLPELEKFYTLAKEASEAQRGSYLKSVQERIGRTADRYRIPRELVFESMPDAPSGGTMRARDPQGKLHEAPAGTPLPAGWKAEP